HPGTRGFAKEWLLHKFLQKEGVLTTMYAFLPVEMNEKQLGLYAFEEHFEKQLLESQDRREGVILKFDEELFWQGILLKNRDNIHHHLPNYQASFARPFGKKKISKSKSLTSQLVLGNNLLEMYRNMNPDLPLYLDVDRYARYLALLTLTNSHAHSAEWHNQRWYVNPVTARLEPVVFDISDGFFPDEGQNRFFEKLMEMDVKVAQPTREYLHALVFKNESFQNQYLAHLERMISTAYLDSAMNEISSEIERVDHALGQEYPNVRVEKGVLFDNVEKLKEHLPMFKNWLKNDLPLLQPDTVNRRPNLHPTISPFIPVKVYEQGNNAYVIENNGGHQVTVFGYESKETKDTVLLPSELKIGVTHWQQDRAELQLTEKARFIYYRITASDFSGKASIFKWPVPRNHSPRVSLRAKQVGNQPQFLTIENGIYKIKKGSHVISELLYIPSNSKLVVQAGTELVFKATGGILSESPIELIGSKDKPIVIQSESLNNQGLTVLQTNTESVLKHVQFQSMNSLSFEGWVLTGGVNFYESDVVLEHCSIDNGRSEDALNIIRSNFELNSCQIKSSFSDGFDSDFSKGTVVNCRFEAIGNDAVDFSG
ncbi:MAG: CotH kinase family protein, partial [Flavobacteriales bacterium]